MNRLFIFAHYDPHDIIDDYVVYYLKKIMKISSKVVFVTAFKNNPLLINTRKTLRYIDENTDYDIGLIENHVHRINK